MHIRPASMLSLGLLPLALAAGACSNSGLGPDPFQQDFSNIADPQARWQAYGIDTYRVTETRACECLPPYRWTAFVRNGKVVDVEVDPVQGIDPEDARRLALKMAWTVEGAFDLIEQAQDADKVAVGYDPRYGFPAGIVIDWDLGMADEETYQNMSDLAPLRK